jgi:FtsH-binding integral membrane protein
MEATLTYKSVSEINDAMLRVYNHMFGAIATSALVSFLIGSNPAAVQFLFTGFIKWIVIFAPLAFIFAVPILLNSGIGRLAKIGVLHAFAAVMAVSFSSIFAVYQLGSIISAFVGAAVLFGTMSLYGYFTKTSLDSLGKWLFVGLIAIIIASIINIFVGSSVAQMTISALAIIIFLGLTAYDTQKIREMVSVGDSNNSVEITGALTLYLDFINLFLSLLQLFGNRKD